MMRPAHGYLIAKIINDTIGPYARVSNGRLYPLLAKLEQSGLIEAYAQGKFGAQGDRQLRTYRVTESGKQRFYDLMRDTSSHPGEYQKLFLQKSFYLYLLPPLELLTVIDHYIIYCQTNIRHQATEAEDIVHRSSNWDLVEREKAVAAMLETKHHLIKQWQLELDWAKSLKAKAMARSHTESSFQELRTTEEYIREEK